MSNKNNIMVRTNGSKPQPRNIDTNSLKNKPYSIRTYYKKPKNIVIRLRFFDKKGYAIKDIDIANKKNPKSHSHYFFKKIIV